MKSIRVYTDGACSGNPGPGGWAFYVVEHRFLESGKSDGVTTNNEMELTAIASAINWIQKANVLNVTIYSDSNYSIKSITEWFKGWERKGETDRPNYPLLEEISENLEELSKRGVKVDFQKVKGHSDDPYNILVDSEAVKCRDQG